MQLAHDLAVLPAFIATAESLIVTNSEEDAKWLKQLNEIFNLGVHAIKRNELRNTTNATFFPWGWSLDLRRRLVKWGAPEQCLPSKESIEMMRNLSHRRTTTFIHKELQQILGTALCPVPVEMTTVSEVMCFVEQHHECYIKTPWSSSGRGIYRTTNGTSTELEQWCRGAIKRQGSLLCEMALNNIMDCAVEFLASNGVASVQGYSIFVTDAHCQYQYGIVAASDVLKNKITSLYPQLDDVVEALTQVLNTIVAPHYNGWLGVDMLLYKKGNGEVSINPCVELNLRPTMGAVTSALGNYILAPGKTATFTIEQRDTTAEPWHQHNGAVIKDGRLHSGTLCVSTPNENALYRATLTVD